MAAKKHPAKKLKKIGVFSLAKSLTLFGAVVGLVAGILYSGIGAIYDAATGAVSSGTVLAFLAIVGMPVMFALAGFVIGAVVSSLYNIAANWVGGVEVDLE